MNGPASRIDARQPDGACAGRARSGKVGWALLWLLGVPLPILLVIYAILS